MDKEKTSLEACLLGMFFDYRYRRILTKVLIPASRASARASTSASVFCAEKLTRREQSASWAESPKADREGLTWVEWEEQADPLDTQIPFADRKFSMV